MAQELKIPGQEISLLTGSALADINFRFNIPSQTFDSATKQIQRTSGTATSTFGAISFGGVTSPIYLIIHNTGSTAFYIKAATGDTSGISIAGGTFHHFPIVATGWGVLTASGTSTYECAIISV